jgi:hypothetical protein
MRPSRLSESGMSEATNSSVVFFFGFMILSSPSCEGIDGLRFVLGVIFWG